MKVQGRRKRGRPKRIWLDKVKDDIKEKLLSADKVYDRATWRRMSSYIDPHVKVRASLRHLNGPLTIQTIILVSIIRNLVQSCNMPAVAPALIMY